MLKKPQTGSFESLLHRHIQYTKPLISKEVRGFVVFGVWKTASWTNFLQTLCSVVETAT